MNIEGGVRRVNDSPHARLFRKKALERLSSPDQLDQLLEITSSKAWLALVAVGFSLFLAVVWGIKGSIPTKVQGQGIIIKTGGVFEIQSMSSGQISQIVVSVGDIIEKGQVVANIDQPDLSNQLKAMDEKISNMSLRLKKVKDDTDVEARMEYLEKQKELLLSTIDSLVKKMGWYKERISSQKKLLADGLITRTQLLSTQGDLDMLSEQIEAKKNDINSLELNKMDIVKNRDLEIKNLTMQIEEAQTSRSNLSDNLMMTSNVVSAYSGRVVEVKVKPGSLVSAGLPLMTLEIAHENASLEAIVYISAMSGKKVAVGMKADVSPSTVKVEEYGFMRGEVTYVSEYPTTSQQMMMVLQNKELVGALSQGGAPIEVRVKLLPDPNTQSGYSWSSPKGPPIDVQSGTLCGGSVTVLEQKPITLVIPWFKSKLGIN
ncbi:MAG: NHLP bacteriocin system secretion protein [Candidatus Wallbacteria bacterium HGW-Wallbacteria-1]|uniref:NHLP bacteriocin system secretion protein n=1 Tax=Candidatus Wallbacteria bacterium HGW-Wallbacteria-1 TaxID=2013854 RepID=A0A2N1PRW4_9BACT|nr:MAG: NHLP bacteriocin system secretion protein [Candidatus Wallbacteria bacterium HGW-Wallbacteria-1]